MENIIVGNGWWWKTRGEWHTWDKYIDFTSRYLKQVHGLILKTGLVRQNFHIGISGQKHGKDFIWCREEKGQYDAALEERSLDPLKRQFHNSLYLSPKAKKKQRGDGVGQIRYKKWTERIRPWEGEGRGRKQEKGIKVSIGEQEVKKKKVGLIQFCPSHHTRLVWMEIHLNQQPTRQLVGAYITKLKNSTVQDHHKKETTHSGRKSQLQRMSWFDFSQMNYASNAKYTMLSVYT